MLIGLSAQRAATPVLPAGVRLRPVTADADMHRIAAMESAVWGQDWSWLGADLIGRIAAARGVRYLQVNASDDSAPILRRLGFRAVTTTTPYVWAPPR